MMNGRRKSDRAIVATKPANKAGSTANEVGAPVAEWMEQRGLAEGKPPWQNTSRALDRMVVQSVLGRIRQAAVKDTRQRFTSLMHHIYNLSMLREAYYGLKRDAAPRVDGETWQQYRENLESNLEELSARLRRGAYRAKSVRRVFIAKGDGRQRPLGVTVLEDKIVQRATVEVLKAIYKTVFIGFSYGYRPGKGQHNALDALYAGLLTRQVTGCWIEISARSLMVLDHEWLVKFIEHRIADQRVLRLIRKWLNADVPNWFLLVDSKGKGPRHRVMPMDGQVRGALLQVIQDRTSGRVFDYCPHRSKRALQLLVSVDSSGRHLWTIRA